MRGVTEKIAWGWYIVWYLFLAGVAAGAGAVAGGVELFCPGRRRLARTLAFFIPVLAGLAGLALVLELGRPARFYLALLYFNPASLMSWGSYLVLLFTGAAAFYLLVWILRWPEAGRRWLAGILLVLSPALASYSGLLFMAIRANPFWAHPLLPAVFWASSLSTGLAFSELAVLAREVRRRYGWSPAWRDFDPWAKPWSVGDLKWLQQLHLLALAGELIFFLLWLTSWLFLPLGPAVLRKLWETGYGLVLGWAVLVLGLLFPLGLSLYARSRTPRDEQGILAWLNPLLVLLGGFMLRYVVVFAGQLIFSPRL